jgi:hypothetical protein
MTEEVAMNSATKHYYANKDAILQYKKQYYQEKNRKLIFLRKLHINGMSKRDSNKVLQLAYDLNKISFEVDTAQGVLDYTLDTFMNTFNINSKTNVPVIGYIAKDEDNFSLCEDININEALEMLNDNNYKLAIIIPIPFFKKIEI